LRGPGGRQRDRQCDQRSVVMGWAEAGVEPRAASARAHLRCRNNTPASGRRGTCGAQPLARSHTHQRAAHGGLADGVAEGRQPHVTHAPAGHVIAACACAPRVAAALVASRGGVGGAAGARRGDACRVRRCVADARICLRTACMRMRARARRSRVLAVKSDPPVVEGMRLISPPDQPVRAWGTSICGACASVCVCVHVSV
jgi:hypothetical protein